MTETLRALVESWLTEARLVGRAGHFSANIRISAT